MGFLLLVVNSDLLFLIFSFHGQRESEDFTFNADLLLRIDQKWVDFEDFVKVRAVTFEINLLVLPASLVTSFHFLRGQQFWC